MPWLFGYGSLDWRVDFEFTDRRDAWIEGWSRRFWQGSPDHRGVPSAPGRVVTLIEDAGARCWGRAYRVPESALPHLDHREKAGYERLRLTAHTREGARLDDVLVYIGGPANPSFLGPASTSKMVEHIATSSGPSGSNAEYLLRLADALASMGVTDEHVQGLAAAVRRRVADEDPGPEGTQPKTRGG